MTRLARCPRSARPQKKDTPVKHPSSRPSSLMTALATAAVAAVLTLAVPAIAQAATPAGPGIAPAAPAGPPTGWVRLGHLSPKTPPVDIYLAPFGQAEKVAFHKAAYGNVTPYTTLQPGAYTVSMRPADASPTSTPALSANIDIKPGVSYTALVFENGPDGTIKPTLLTDDLTAPAAGTGKVRIVEAATGKAPIDITAVGGPVLASGLKYGDSSAYTTVPEGRWSLALKSGANTTQDSVDVRSGSVSTVVVVDTPGVGLKLTPLKDSAGTASAPAGGVATGGGSTAPADPMYDMATFLLPALLAGGMVGSLTVWVRRRARV